MGALLSSEMDHAYINGDVLRWARERRSLSVSELAKSVGASASQLTAWEEGEIAPPFGKAEDLANALHIPFGMLYLSARPDDSKVDVPDLRTLKDTQRKRLSPDFIDVINDVLRKQDWYREYSELNSLPKLHFVARFSMTDGVAKVASHLRNTLNINDNMRKRARNWAKYLSLIADAAENVGILVIRHGYVQSDNNRKLSVKEFRGFALSDPYAPVVFVNTRDFHAPRVFTLVHELAHIWIGESGVSNPDPSAIPSGAGKNAIERFCNLVATEVLTPKSQFIDSWDAALSAEVNTARLTTQFRVSALVVLRRASDLGLINKTQFATLCRGAREKQTPIPKPSSRGANPYASIRLRNSVRFTDTVLRALRQQKLLYRDASRLLSVSYPTLDELAKRSHY